MKINLLLSIILLTGCSPKYIIKTTKLPPSTKEGKVCFKSCNQTYESDKQAFIQKCQNKIKVCAVETESRVTANFYKYKQKYQEDLSRYKKELVHYQNSMILYREKMDNYRDKKSELRDKYNEKMDDYYDEKRDYSDKLDKYNAWKREKDENEEDKIACSSSSNGDYACKKVREYEAKYRFLFSSDIPKKPRYEPKRPRHNKSLSKPIKPVKPLIPTEPVLSLIIEKEKNKCASSCEYPLENSCFSSCGGTIKHEKVCVENCKEI